MLDTLKFTGYYIFPDFIDQMLAPWYVVIFAEISFWQAAGAGSTTSQSGLIGSKSFENAQHRTKVDATVFKNVCLPRQAVL